MGAGFPIHEQARWQNAAKDLETARQSCEKFKLIPTSVISFAEGTRFETQKHEAQQSPYRYLLKPKVGALAMALDTMGPLFTAMLDVTIVYPKGVPSFWDLLCGRVHQVRVHVNSVPIPADFTQAQASLSKDYRPRLQAWMNDLWAAKDAQIEVLRSPLTK